MVASSLSKLIHTYVDANTRNGQLPANAGIAVAGVLGRDVLFLETVGLRERARGEPVTAQTLFDIGSLTKSFTAAAVLLAEEEGRIQLELPIAQTRNAFLRLGSAEVAAELSVLDILAHRTGLPAHDLLWYFGGWSTPELVERIAHLPLIPGGFRKTFTYNNLLYGSLEMLFRQQLGTSWLSCLETRILRPLNLQSVRCGGEEGGFGPNVAQPYAGTLPMPRKDLSSIAAAGGLRANIEDMARWVSAHLIQDTGLSRESRDRMFARQVSLEGVSPQLTRGLEWLQADGAYGLGWFLGSFGNHRVIYHPGFVDGFSSLLVLLPELRLGFAVLTNLNLSPVPGLLVQELVMTALGVARSTPSPTPLAIASTSTIVPTARANCGLAPGAYEDEAYGTLEVVEVDGQLSLVYRDRAFPLLTHEAGDLAMQIHASGLDLMLPVMMDATDPGAFSIPLALDPRVPLQRFSLRRHRSP